jgi:hypothetical protein
MRGVLACVISVLVCAQRTTTHCVDVAGQVQQAARRARHERPDARARQETSACACDAGGGDHMLTCAQGASAPLYLRVACEELRLFGVFERLTQVCVRVMLVCM